MRAGRRFGRLLLTVTHQSRRGPRIDGAVVYDAERNRYEAIVFGTGRRAPVVGWRTNGPMPVPFWTWPRRAPRPLRPAAAFLFAPRGAR